MTTNGHMHEGTPPADEEKLLRLLANRDEAAAMLGEARDFWRLAEVVVLIGVGALLGRRARRNQEAGQVPV